MKRRDLLRGGLAAAAVAVGLDARAGPAAVTIPSVRGPVRADDLGVTLPHEHPACGWDWRRVAYPGPPADALTEEQRREQEGSVLAFWDLLGAKLKQNGVGSILDARSEHSGRAVDLLQVISRRTGLNIMCVTGYYVRSQRPRDFVSRGLEAARDHMIKELVDGIGNTGVRAAAIKLAVGGRPKDDSDDLMLNAGALAQKATSCAITTHATTPESRGHLIDVLEQRGADLSRVAIGHADANGSAQESQQLLQRAGYVLYTIWGITNPKLIGSRTPVLSDHSARLVRSLLDRGLVKQIMFSIDFSVYQHQGGIVLRLYDIPERTSNFMFTFVLPQLRRLGISEDEIRQMMVENPRRHLCGT
ncbi:MAG: hypothetical protein GEU99_03565 [Luteitalea sp.]|nr:hypothetical protein [Luteitalea sp.]